MRGPVVESEGPCLETAQIFTVLADRLSLVPEIPDDLHQAAGGDRMAFGVKLMQWAASEPRAMKSMPFVLAKTLGRLETVD